MILATVYTDGSIFPNPGGPEGWAFVAVDRWGEITERNGGTPAAPGNSNNRAEMMAMLRALEWLQGCPAEIFTDSQYVMNGMNTWWQGWIRKGWRRMEHGVQVPIPNADLWQQMLPLRKPGQTIAWVRGHDGNHYNEIADKLAEAGRLSVTEVAA
jgi:ribonuclease HI